MPSRPGFRQGAPSKTIHEQNGSFTRSATWPPVYRPTAVQPKMAEPTPAVSHTPPVYRPQSATMGKPAGMLRGAVPRAVQRMNAGAAGDFLARLSAYQEATGHNLVQDWMDALRPGAAPTATAPVAALSDTQAAALEAALVSAEGDANSAGYINNDAQVALKDAIAAVVGGKNKTHNRGGGHRGSSTGSRTIQQTLSDCSWLTSSQKASINGYLATRGGTRYYV